MQIFFMISTFLCSVIWLTFIYQTHLAKLASACESISHVLNLPNVGILGSEFNTSSFTIGRVQCTRPNVSGVCISVHEAWRDFVIKFFTLHPCVPWIWDSVWPSVIFHASMLAPVCMYINAVLETMYSIWWQWTLCRHCNWILDG